MSGKPYYQHVRAIIPVSNCQRNDDGILKLRHKIVNVARQQSYWGEARPIKWLMLADELKERANKLEEKCIKMSDVHQAAKECGLQNNVDVTAFLTFHHNLGDLIYFDDNETRDTVILCPQWLASVFR